MATPRPALGPALNSSIAGLGTGATRSAGPRFLGVRGWLRSGLVLGASACVGLLSIPGTAAADPTPTDLTQMVADASHQLEVVSEQVNSAQVELSQQQAAAQQADQAAADAQTQLTAIQGKVAQIARSAYTTGDVSRLDSLLSSRSPKEFVAQMGTLDAIAGHQAAVLTQASATEKTAQKARAQADSDATAAKATLTQVSAKQSQLQAQIADYQKQYAALTALQQQAADQAVSGQTVARPAAAAPAAAPAPAAALAAARAPAAAPAPAAAASSQAAQIAVNTALAQVGKPYVWGASGPRSFDCSGLTMYSYAAAGVALPHSSSAQSGMGRPVSRDQLQPGDLVFFYSPVSHVGMYIGNGQIVHASTSGVPVKVVSLDSLPDYNSARRIAG